MSYPPRPRHAPPWDSPARPRLRHQAAPPPRHQASPERSRLSDGLILFWTITAIVVTIGGVIVTTALWPSLAGQ
jgi:hypothetical protein